MMEDNDIVESKVPERPDKLKPRGVKPRPLPYLDFQKLSKSSGPAASVKCNNASGGMDRTRRFQWWLKNEGRPSQEDIRVDEERAPVKERVNLFATDNYKILGTVEERFQKDTATKARLVDTPLVVPTFKREKDMTKIFILILTTVGIALFALNFVRK